jgi:cyclohexadienyl dehydratase
MLRMLCAVACVFFSTHVPAAFAASTLEHVLSNGVLKVCTSGDYRPFSYTADGARFEGADIEMAQSLADSLNARVEFVRTAWADLAMSMKTERCDIAMGGISISLERMRQASYSEPYLRDGKFAITQCALASRFVDLEAIDQPDVRVLVNPGGTNQVFDRVHLHRASVTVFPDNATIFDEIAAGRGDVMITDQSEVKLQVKRHPGVLCPISAKAAFSFGEKAYLLPQDDPTWQGYVNQWLHIQLENGNFAAVSKRWLD